MSESKNKHAVELGRLGGKSRSRAKIAAARANGSKGGRPKLQRKKRQDRTKIRETDC